MDVGDRWRLFCRSGCLAERRGIPQVDRLVLRSDRQVIPAWREGDRIGGFKLTSQAQDKLGGEGVPLSGPLADVREALLSLGLSPQEASEALGALPPGDGRPVEELLREALRQVGRG